MKINYIKQNLNYILIILGFVLIIAPVGGSLSLLPQTDVVNNGSFNGGEANWIYQHSGTSEGSFTINYGGLFGTYGSVTTSVSGDGSCFLSQYIQSVNIVSGSDYILQFYYKGYIERASIYVWDENWSYIIGYFLYPGYAPDWTQVSLVITDIVEGSIYGIRFSSNSVGVFDVDEVQFGIDDTNLPTPTPTPTPTGSPSPTSSPTPTPTPEPTPEPTPTPTPSPTSTPVIPVDVDDIIDEWDDPIPVAENVSLLPLQILGFALVAIGSLRIYKGRRKR